MCTTGQELFVVGIVDDKLDAWDLAGVYTSEVLAVVACHGPEYFVLPVPRGCSIVPGSWSGAYFPKGNGQAQ